jgi:2-oxoglutarate ferredoxin oxidoreductase subunit alpha
MTQVIPEQGAAGQSGRVLIDGSRMICEALVQAGADVFVGYPITPANLIYLYSTQRFELALSAPDEITTLQWMSGFAAAGRLPVTATSFPGYALMIESINMAYMMELPMVIVLAQRLGPATGTATCGAQGDLSVINGTLSGGYPLPTLCISSLADCWDMSAKAVQVAVTLRTPVVLLTSKEIVMTARSFDLNDLPPVTRIERPAYQGSEPYRPYEPDTRLVPPFVPVGDERFQVRLTASTHDADGVLQNTTAAAIKNTLRLPEKLLRNLPDYACYDLDEEAGAEVLLVSYDITSLAAREAVGLLRARGEKVSLLIAKTLLPVPPDYADIMGRYARVVFAEENLGGEFRQIMFGYAARAGVSGVNAVGRMLTPGEIIAEVRRLHE